MICARRAALNNVFLDEVHEKIVIHGIEPSDGKETISATSAASGYGQRVTGARRDTLDITITFAIDIHKDDMPGRSEALEAANAWAAIARDGAWLTLNYKPNRRIRVKLAQAPGEGSLWDYSKDFTITFRAYGLPYWEEEVANSVTFGGGAASGSGTAQISGSALTQCDVELANMSGMTINNCTLSVGNKTMTFSSLGLGNGEALIVDHNDGLVRIRIRNGGSYRSAMANRAGANDFMIAPGNNGCSFSADRACRMTVSWRSRFL